MWWMCRFVWINECRLDKKKIKTKYIRNGIRRQVEVQPERGKQILFLRSTPIESNKGKWRGGWEDSELRRGIQWKRANVRMLIDEAGDIVDCVMDGDI